jgi:hypothetical protein
VTWSSAIATSQKKSLLTLPAPSRAKNCKATAVPLLGNMVSAMILTFQVIKGGTRTDWLSLFVTALETSRGISFSILANVLLAGPEGRKFFFTEEADSPKKNTKDTIAREETSYVCFVSLVCFVTNRRSRSGGSAVLSFR